MTRHRRDTVLVSSDGDADGDVDLIGDPVDAATSREHTSAFAWRSCAVQPDPATVARLEQPTTHHAFEFDLLRHLGLEPPSDAPVDAGLYDDLIQYLRSCRRDAPSATDTGHDEESHDDEQSSGRSTTSDE